MVTSQRERVLTRTSCSRISTSRKYSLWERWVETWCEVASCETWTRVFSNEALRVVLESIGHTRKIRTWSLASTSEYFEHQVSSSSRAASILTLDDSPGKHEISVLWEVSFRSHFESFGLACWGDVVRVRKCSRWCSRRQGRIRKDSTCSVASRCTAISETGSECCQWSDSREGNSCDCSVSTRKAVVSWDFQVYRGSRQCTVRGCSILLLHPFVYHKKKSLEHTNRYGRFKKTTKHVILIESLVELNKLTINDIKKAEFVICAEDVFKKSEIYWTRFASFVGVAQMPSVGNDEKKKGSRLSRAFEIRYADALRRLQSRVSQMVMGNNEKTPKELREDILKDLQSTQDFLVKNAPFVQEKVRGVRACCQKKYSNKLCLL